MVLKDPASIESQQEAEDELFAICIGIEVAAFSIIAERLGKLQGESWRDIYAAMPQDLARIREAVESGREQALNASQNILEGMAASNDGWMSYYYAAQGVEQTTSKDNPKLQAALKEQLDKAQEVIRAEVNTSVIGIVDKDKVFHNIEDAYKMIVSDAASAMTSGEAYFDSVVAEATETLADCGLKIQYPNTYTVRESQGKGKPVKIITKTRETPLVRNLYSAVTSNVMNAYRVAMTDMRFIQGEEFGADAVRVSAHALCAPDHLPYQGGIYTKDEWKSIQGSLSRQFVYGSNCGHTVSPTIYSIAMKEYDKAYIDRLNSMSTKRVSFKGLSGEKLTMTRYEASQYQRKLETQVRKSKEMAYLLEIEEKSAADAAKAAREYTAAYDRISKEAGLSTRPDRMKIYTSD